MLTTTVTNLTVLGS